MIHCHIAVQPVPPHRLDPEIPEVLSAIAMKLMSKDAEDRYQNAFGVMADLTVCREQFEKTGTMTSFELGLKDRSSRFILPQTLYGREKELDMLIQSFDQACEDDTQEWLV